MRVTNFILGSSLLTVCVVGVLVISAQRASFRSNVSRTQTIVPIVSKESKSWIKSSVPFEQWADAIAFGDHDLVALVGSKTLLLSKDGGKTWELADHGRGEYRVTNNGSTPAPETTQSTPITTSELCTVEDAMIVVNRLYAKAVCEHVGQLWSIPLREDQPWHVWAFAPSDDQDITYGPRGRFVRAGGKILITANLPQGPTLISTDNDGASWRPIAQIGCDIAAFDFVDARQGWVFCRNGEVFETETAGTSWTRRFSLPSEVGSQIRSVKFATADKAFVVGENGMIWITNDRGETWSALRIETPQNLRSVQILDKNTAWIVGPDGLVLQTKDGGLTWEKIDLGYGKNSYPGIAVANNTAWVVSHNEVFHSP